VKLNHLPLIALGAGLLLVGLSLVWPRMIGSTVWTEEQARQFSEASANVHQAAHDHSHDAGAAADDQKPQAQSLEEARRRFEQSRAQLDRAQSLRAGTARVLKWAGAVCVVLGAAAHFLLRHSPR
jgi:hypothetical protein